MKPKDWASGLLGVLILLYALCLGTMSILRHDSLGSSTFDLGNMDQAVWNTLHGRLLRFTSYPKIGQTRLAAHVEPILVPISLLYLIYSSPKTLLVLQTVALSLAAWPLFLLGRAKLGDSLMALAPALAYLLTPALQAVNLFDFHPIALAPPFLLFGLYFLEKALTEEAPSRTNYALFALFILLALSCQESVALLVVAMGLYACLAHRRWRVGLLTMMVGAWWFYVTVYLIIPHFRQGGSGSPYLSYYRELGDTPLKMAFTLLTRPGLFLKYVLTRENFQVVTALLLPFAGLPLLGWPVLLLAGPALAIVLLSANPLTHQLERYHYAATILPFVAAAAVYGLACRWLKHRPMMARLLAVLMVLVALGYQRYRGFLPLALPFRWPQVTPHHRLLPEMAAMIPAQAAVAAQPDLFPHLSQRETIYLWRPPVQEAEYIVLDISHPQFTNRNEAHSRLREEVLSDGPFGLIASRDGYLLLKRGAPHAPLSDDFYTFARVEKPAIQYPMIVDFGPDNERSLLRFLGFDVLYDREEEVKFDLYWQVLQPMEGDEFITLYLIDAAGKVVGSIDRAQPTLIWYPIQDWRPGETVRLLVNTLGWWTGDRSEYGIALGVMKGRDTWEVSRRWSPLVQESELIPRLRAEGTLLELMRFRRIFGLPRALEERRIFQRPRLNHPLEVDLEGQVRLVGYDLKPARLKAGHTANVRCLRLTLYWQAQKQMCSSYTVFAHLLDEDGLLRGQQDHVPGGGTRPTTTWLEGEYVIDEHQITLQEDAPPGPYHLEVGMYEKSSGQRLNVLDGQGRIQGDSVPLDIQIQVTR